MYKRLLLLNGLAIFAVVCNHAAGFGQIGLFLWADSYRPVVIPDWTQLGTFSHYFLLVIRQISTFCVPAFMFVSGFFVSYAAQNNRNLINWSFSRIRITTLIIPYFIWSIVIIAGELLQGSSRPLLEYLLLIISKGVIPPYWFIPALCFFYLISPILVRLVKQYWKLTLIASGFIQLTIVIINYIQYTNIDYLWLGFIHRFLPSWLAFNWIFFFTFGICFGFHIQEFKKWIDKYQQLLFILVIMFGLLNILESDYFLRTTLQNWGATNGTITYNLYTTIFILWFLTLKKVSFSNQINQLGIRSYGIYLLHYPLIEFVARVVHKTAPRLLAYPVVLVPLFTIVGIGLPVLIMDAFRRSIVKRYYRYVFA